MVIINIKEEWESLSQLIDKQPFIYLQMYSDVNLHPRENRIAAAS